VNETFVRRFWPADDPIGRTFQVVIDRSTNGDRVRVVGVARDAKYVSLGEDPQPHVYLPIRQHDLAGQALIVRTVREDPRMLNAVERELRALDPDLHGFFPRTLEEHVGVARLPSQISTALAVALAALASGLALVGLYASVAFMVAQRTRELALRIALGAAPADVRRLVIGHALRLAGVGVGIGVALAAAGTPLLRSQLFGVSPTDPAAFAAVSCALVAVSVSASIGPARRAMRLNPAVALKEQ
jgi:hypothetical protein